MMDTLHPRIVSTLSVLIILTSTLSFAQGSSTDENTGPDWLRGPYLNVVMSANNDAEMREFYGEVLALESLSDLLLSPRRGRPMAVTMIRYKLGLSQIKMLLHNESARPPGGPQRVDGTNPDPIPKRSPGGRSTANGLRVLSIPTEKGGLMAARIQEFNGTKVEWEEESGYKVAWVKDPDDNEIEIRWYPEGASYSTLSRLELVLTVDDMDSSRKHYGEILGLPASPMIEKVGFNGETFQYQVGESILRLWSSGEKLPTDTGWTKNGYGLRYVQFIVKDAYALHDHLAESGAGIAQGPTALGQRTTLMFAEDPDGVINECVGPGKK